MLPIRWHGLRLALLAEKALWWPDESTLFVADPHFGKDAAFRSAGIPVPAACAQETLDRLDRALQRTAAERLVFLGDFLHAQSGRTAAIFEALTAWRARNRPLRIDLIRGNHDLRAGDPPEALEIACLPEGHTYGSLALHHDPPSSPGAALALCGHLHPAVRLHDAAGEVRLPCFWMRDRVCVLPAFGAFTGMKVIRPRRGESVYVVVQDRVLEVTGPPAATI